jgi:hypothetical protein
MFGQRLRMDPSREFADLNLGRFDPGSKLGFDVADEFCHTRQVALSALAQLPLETAALVVCGLDDPTARRFHFGDSRTDLGLEAGVRDREAGR